jgi:hypothetical protein
LTANPTFLISPLWHALFDETWRTTPVFFEMQNGPASGRRRDV